MPGRVYTIIHPEVHPGGIYQAMYTLRYTQVVYTGYVHPEVYPGGVYPAICLPMYGWCIPGYMPPYVP